MPRLSRSYQTADGLHHPRQDQRYVLLAEREETIDRGIRSEEANEDAIAFVVLPRDSRRIVKLNPKP